MGATLTLAHLELTLLVEDSTLFSIVNCSGLKLGCRLPSDHSKDHSNPAHLVSSVIQGYGTSEIQFGQALKKHDRSSYILQTKGGPREDPRVFRSSLEMSFKKLQVSRTRLV